MDTIKKQIRIQKDSLHNHNLGFKEFCKFYKNHKCTWFQIEIVSYHKMKGTTEKMTRDAFTGCQYIRDGICCFDCEYLTTCTKETLCLLVKEAKNYNPSSRGK